MALPIGGFMPIPLAMMIPFMATQSMVMGDAFGRAFQYGKRKISAMSNEEFNATSIEEQASLMFKAYANIIPDLKQSIQDTRSLQALIVTELLRLPTSIFQEVVGSTGDATSIREDTGSINQEPIGTQTPQGVIVGYIDGIPQYAAIPTGSTSRRAPTGPTPQAPLPEIPLLDQMVEIKIRNQSSSNATVLETRTVRAWRSILAGDRNKVGQASGSILQKFYLDRIIAIQQYLNVHTQSFN